MSIDKRVSPLFKVREDLNGSKTARKKIKVLTNLRVLLCPSCYRHSGLPDLKSAVWVRGSGSSCKGRPSLGP